MTPVSMRHPYDDAVTAELERWPGVTASRVCRSKHYALNLMYDGRTRFVIYPNSPGDTVRGVRNHLRDVRAALREIGARRDTEPKAARVVRRRRAPPAAPAAKPLVRTEVETGASPERDPFAVLSALKIAPKSQPKSPEPWWSRAWKLVKEMVA